MLAGLVVGLAIGLAASCWMWAEWVTGHPIPLVFGLVGGLTSAASLFPVDQAMSSFWLALTAGWLVALTLTVGSWSGRGHRAAAHLAALPVSRSQRAWVAFLDVVRDPIALVGYVRLRPLQRSIDGLASTTERVIVPDAPLAFRGLAGWFLGLGLDAEQACWAAQLVARCDPALDLADPTPLLDDHQVTILAVCRGLASGAHEVVLERPLSGLEPRLARSVDRMIRSESDRRKVTVVDTRSALENE